MKKVWITALAQEQVSSVIISGTASQYGLTADGHFWSNDLEGMAWLRARDMLREQEITLWVIAGKAEDLELKTCYGLTLLVLCIRAERPDLSILWVDTGEQINLILPSVFTGIPLVRLDSSLLGAKLAARANMPTKASATDCRLRVHAHPGFGVWFEVGPGAGQEEWSGAMFALNGGEIRAHGVGTAGVLPQRCVLEFPMQGIRLSLGEMEYSGWAVANRLDEESSYFIKVDGVPSAFLFGPLAEDDAIEAHMVRIMPVGN